MRGVAWVESLPVLHGACGVSSKSPAFPSMEVVMKHSTKPPPSRGSAKGEPRKHPAPGGYPPGQPTPDPVPPRAPGTGSPHEHQNDPDCPPGKGNG